MAVIASQQLYAGFSSVMMELINIKILVNDVIALEKGSINKAHIKIKTDLQDAIVKVNKSKFFNILVNLFNNAKQAMLDKANDKKILTFSSSVEGKKVLLKISDTGIGIDKTIIKKIFNHGFTTKKDGHGFGLHSCANYMAEMKGNMWAESDGKDKGVTFILEFPLADDDNASKSTTEE